MGGILHPDAHRAQSSAREALEVLVRRSSASPFCEIVAGEQELLQQLQEFSELSPPTLVWKQGGRFSKLFVFLAVRFLSNPSHVLECEGIHARWQWLGQGRRSVKMKTMNSVLKLSAYMLYQGDLPPADVLLPHIQLTRLHMREMYQLACQGHVAPGARAEWVYRDRFNLSLADANLLRAPQAQRKQGGNSSPQVRRRKKTIRTYQIIQIQTHADLADTKIPT
jgi:hypothetical protein